MPIDELGLVAKLRGDLPSRVVGVTPISGIREIDFDWPTIKAERAEAAAAIERLLAERDEARRVKRWNVDEMGGTLHVCRGEHDGDNCEWESFVPAGHLHAAEAQRDKLKEALQDAYALLLAPAEDIKEGVLSRARQALQDSKT